MQTQDVREAAQSAVDQSKSFLSKQVDERSTQIGQQIESVAQDLRNVSNQLRQGETVGAAATYVDQGVELIERVAQYLQDVDGDRLIGDLENYARRQPWAVAAGALVLGFAAARFLKTSSARRYRDAYGGGAGTDRDDGTAGRTYGGAGNSYGAAGGYATSRGYGESSYGETSYGETSYGERGGMRGGGQYAT